MRRHRFALVSGMGAEREGDAPFSTINTTPLIDVMLVLLIMIVITIPMQMNEVPLNLPQPGPAKSAVTHALVLDRAGRVSVNGAVLNEPALTARLRRIATVGDVLTMQTDPEARYERFAETLATVKRAGVTRLGFSDGRPVGF